MRTGRLSVLVWGLVLSCALVCSRLGLAEQASGAGTPKGFSINFSPVNSESLKIESYPLEGERLCYTLSNRVYVWWQVDGYELELQADSIVIFLTEKFNRGRDGFGGIGSVQDFLEAEWVDGIYLAGDVILAEGTRSIRAEEMYFDVLKHQALMLKAELKGYDERRKIPLYVRADELSMLAMNVFSAEDVVLTTSEFYRPQVSIHAAKVLITDMTLVDAETGKLSDHSFDAQLEDVRVKAGEQTVFYWPSMRANLERPDLPLKGARVGHDSRLGSHVQTRWHMWRMLDRREPEGTDGTVLLDYFDKRGPGAGFELDYVQEDMFGRAQGYFLHDQGEDQLGRNRRNLTPPHEERGRLRLQHRQFLDHGWQWTTEVGYLSDQNFLEQFYRGEFYAEKEQETLFHLKRIEDNWGVAVTTKARINDHANQLEELPSAELHWTGQSLYGDLLTFYSDTQMGRFRHRFGKNDPQVGTDNFYTLATTRNELDMPLRLPGAKLVPFTAASATYDSGPGFSTDVDGSPVAPQETVFVGELGLRFFLDSYWRVFPEVRSRLWDLNQIRHVIEPHATAVAFWADEAAGEQRDVLSVGLRQRWQTKRGRGAKQRVVDWLELNVDLTWVNHDGAIATNGPSRLFWNNPFVPNTSRFTRGVPPTDRRSTPFFGPSRDYSSTDFIWRLTDSTAIMGDAYYDHRAGVVRQSNIGVSHMRWPDLNLYVGSRYLRDVMNDFGQVGTNVLSFAAVYKLDPRYALVCSQAFDLDYGANLRSEVTVLRKYHRLNYGLTFSLDESLDDSSIVFSLWPEGIAELATGVGRYVGLGI